MNDFDYLQHAIPQNGKYILSMTRLAALKMLSKLKRIATRISKATDMSWPEPQFLLLYAQQV